jgi:hypothetical protein
MFDLKIKTPEPKRIEEENRDERSISRYASDF